MKNLKFLIPLAALCLLAGPAAAQGDNEAEREANVSEAEVARRLAAAEAKMAEAAREIAELSSHRMPQLREVERRVAFMSDSRPRLGVNIGEDTKSGPVEGVEIVAVTPGSAADDAGLRSGDIITAINGESLSAESSFAASERILDFMEGVEEGDILELEYLRDGKVGKVEVEPRPVSWNWRSFNAPRDFSMPDVHIAPHVVDRLREGFAFAWPGGIWADMELVELNEGLGKYFGADSGVLVVSAPESDALQLEDGDVILSIDAREPTSVRHALRILGSYQAGESLELEIMRDKRKRTLDITIPDDRSGMLWRPAPAPQPASAPRPPAAPRPDIEKT